jgi:hypothetical protein
VPTKCTTKMQEAKVHEIRMLVPVFWSAPIWYTSGYIRDPAFIVAYSVGAL